MNILASNTQLKHIPSKINMLAWFNFKKVLDKYDISKQRKQKLKPLHIHHSLENIKILEGIQMFSDTIICLYHPTTRIPNSSSSSVHMRVTFPRAPLPRDKHRFVQSSHQRERSPELQIFQGRFFIRICTSRLSDNDQNTMIFLA